MVAPFRKTKSLRSEDEEQDFQLVVKMTFLEYVPDRVSQRSRSRSAPAICKNNGSAVHGPASVFSRKLSDESITGSMGSESTGGDASLGSTLHQFGTCKPCAWFWKPSGCTNGAQCRHCHLCPFGELGRRKRQNRKLARSSRDSAPTTSDTSSPEGDLSTTESAEPPAISAVPGPVPGLKEAGRVEGVEGVEGADGVQPNPRRLVPRAQTWQGTTTATTSQRITFVRAQTWQTTVNLQTVPEGSLSSPVVFLLPVVPNVLPVTPASSPCSSSPSTQTNSGL